MNLVKTIRLKSFDQDSFEICDLWIHRCKITNSILNIQSNNGFQERPLSKYSYSNHNTNGSHNMPHYCIVIIKCWFHIDLFEWDLMIWMISIIMIMIIMIRKKERKKEEYCYAIQYNDRFQLIQWSNIMISWISIDSIAKQPLRLQCVWVIVPFGFDRINCIILSVDWIAINESFDRFYIIDNRTNTKTNTTTTNNNNHEDWWLNTHHQSDSDSDSDWSILSNHSIHDQQYQSDLMVFNMLK